MKTSYITIVKEKLENPKYLSVVTNKANLSQVQQFKTLQIKTQTHCKRKLNCDNY